MYSMFLIIWAYVHLTENPVCVDVVEVMVRLPTS